MPGHLDLNSFSNVQLEQFQTRLKARLFLILIFLVQGSLRVERVAQSETSLFDSSDWILLITFGFIIILITLIIAECLLFKKLGPKILKYTHIIDGIFFLFFTMEWMTTWYVTLVRFKDPTFKCLRLASIIGFTSFAWRALLQNLIVKRWYIRCIAPIFAYASVMGFTINKMDHDSTMDLVKGITYIFYITVIYYFEDKVNWNLMLTSAQRDKWIKINDYILNNIPEKIAILDDKGEILYINDYLKAFIKQCNFSQDPKRMFKEIKHLQKQFDTMETGGACFTDKGLLEKHSSGSLLDHDQEKDTINDEPINCLESLIKNYQIPVGDINVHIDERSLQIYRGKLRLEDKLEKSIEVKISRIKQDSKYYIILILQDTTQRDLLVTLESNNRYKDYLLASVSHELRTPLNGTINLVEAAISKDQVPAEVKEDLLRPALKSSKFLLHLINDILDMSQITAQKLRLAFQSRDLKETLLDCLQLVELSAKKKNIELVMDLHANLPEVFCTDHNRISQIVLNLLSNSIKFTQKGVIKLIAVAIEQSSYIRISIEDSGIGMSREDISKLFQTYTHIDNEGKRNLNPTGVGLGLNIAYNLAGLLGPNGNKGITVDSTPDKGSIFSFLVTNQEMNHEPLPLLLHSSSPDDGDSNVSAQLAIDIEPTLDQKMISRYSTKSMKRFTEYGLLSSVLCECPKVLAVDDDPFNMLAYESVLGSLHVKLDTAYGGRLAIDKLLDRAGMTCSSDCKCYRVIFIDREMPGMSGCEAVKEIRRLEKQNKLPKMNIIGCTGHGGMKEVEEFIKSGIDQCIQKPIKKDIIKEVLEKYGL